MKQVSLFHVSVGPSHEDLSHLCEAGEVSEANMGLKISSIFLVLIFSCIGIFFPLVSCKIKWLRISQSLQFFAKFFGTGIIIGTGFAHLLEPAIESLKFSPCLVGIWKEFNFSSLLIMAGVLSIFLLKLFSLRYISSKYENSIHITSTSHAHIFNKNPLNIQKSLSNNTEDDFEKSNVDKYLMKKDVITLFMLELGIIFHSIIIGLTLAVAGKNRFIVLYIMLGFHQMFEGLSLGIRLFELNHNNLCHNLFFAFIYVITTPVSIAIGLVIKGSLNLHSSTSTIVFGIFNSYFSGVLLYTGLVDLLNEDFIVDSELRNGNLAKLLSAIFYLILGFIIMIITNKWI